MISISSHISRLFYYVIFIAFVAAMFMTQYLSTNVAFQLYPNASDPFHDFPLLANNTTMVVNEPQVDEWLSAVNYTIPFVPADEYRGASLEGWQPTSDRNVENYIGEKVQNFIVVPKPLEDCEILVIVHSTLSSFNTRNQIRQSWLKFNTSETLGIKVLFLVGMAQPFLQTIMNQKLNNESTKFEDVIQAPLVEHYQNLTLKSMFTLKYYLEESHFKNGKIPQYLFKVDDDTFINLPALKNTISQNQPQNSNRFILGFVLGSKKKPSFPIRMAVQSKLGKKETSKWWCPPYMYSGRQYPMFVSGSGYIIGRSAAKCVYKAGLRLPYFHLEDVFITGFCAEWCNVPRIDSDSFHAQYFNLEKVNLKSDLLYHYIQPNSKDLLYKLFNYDTLEKRMKQVFSSSTLSPRQQLISRLFQN